MRISNTDYRRLQDMVVPVLRDFAPIGVYLDEGKSPMRWRWDVLWETKARHRDAMTEWWDRIYSAGMNDAHVDTALRRIINEYHGSKIV